MILQGRPPAVFHRSRLDNGSGAVYDVGESEDDGVSKVRKWWEENRGMMGAIFALAWPAMLEQLLQTVVQYADSAMVGQMGALASAAVGLTTPVNWLVNSPMFAMGVGFLACISRAMGARDEKTARTAAMQSIFAVLALGAGMGILTVALSPWLPGWLNASEEIDAQSARYFAIVCLPMVFRASTIIFGAALRASGDTRTPMLVSLLMNAVNIILNVLLIFPARTATWLGHAIRLPGAGWGVTGAAVATAASYVVSGSLMFVALLRSKALSPRGRRLRLDKPVMGQCIRIGLPVVFTRIGVSLGHVVFLAQVSSLGTVSLAAHSLALTAEEAVYLPGYGMQAAASTLAGNAVGERNEAKLMRLARLITATAMALMTLTGAVMLCFPAQLLSIFTPDQAVIGAGAVVMRIIAVTEPIYALGIILEGVFNGVGDTRAPFVISIATMWGIRILFTAICVHVFHLGLTAVWCCMAADNVVRALLLGLRFLSGRWKRGIVWA